MNPSQYNISNNAHICKFSQPTNKKDTMLASITRESKGTHLHHRSNTRIHLLSRKSIIHCKVKSASNVQCYNIVPLVLSMNSYRLIVPGCAPNVHLIPYWNVNDRKDPSTVFPSLVHSPSKNLVIPFHAVTHLPSSTSTPIVGNLSLGKASLHLKIQKKAYFYLKTIIPVIACSWK